MANKRIWTDDELTKVREMRAAGITYKVIAEEFDVGQTTIQRLLNATAREKQRMYQIRRYASDADFRRRCREYRRQWYQRNKSKDEQQQ